MEKTTKEEVLLQKDEVKTEIEPQKVLTKKVWINSFKLFGKIAL